MKLYPIYKKLYAIEPSTYILIFISFVRLEIRKLVCLFFKKKKKIDAHKLKIIMQFHNMTDLLHIAKTMMIFGLKIDQYRYSKYKDNYYNNDHHNIKVHMNIIHLNKNIDVLFNQYESCILTVHIKSTLWISHLQIIYAVNIMD